jgi:hypothetical protein
MEPPSGGERSGGDGVTRLRERERRRGKERREEEERAARWFKHLSRANRIGIHASYDIWPVSRTTTVGATESR